MQSAREYRGVRLRVSAELLQELLEFARGEGVVLLRHCPAAARQEQIRRLIRWNVGQAIGGDQCQEQAT